MKITNHLLDAIPYVASPNRSGKFKAGLPDTLIIHYTAGPSMESAKNTFLNPAAKASAHIIIDRDGSILQMVPFDTIAWHAGVSQWKQRRNLNNYSIGIELVNAGSLVKEKKGYSSWFGRQYTAKEVVKAVHRNEDTASYWHSYTAAQLKACENLCKLLMEVYGIQTILGHEEISLGRKTDPGPAFPLDALRAQLEDKTQWPSGEVKAKVEGNKRKVKASSLNIRKGPGTQHETLAAPLPKDHEVEILESKDGWVKVKTTAVIEGWVSERFVG